MRNKISLLLFLAVLTGLSCNKDNDQKPGFDLLYQQDFVIPAGIGTFDVHHFQIRNISSRYLQTLDQHGKTNADITGVLTSQATLDGIFGDADFSFIQQVSLRIYNENDPTDYVEIAYRDPTPLEPGSSLPLIPSLADAKRFIEQPLFSLDVVLWLRKTTQVETETRLNLQMKATY